jgi:hypothetical protein
MDDEKPNQEARMQRKSGFRIAALALVTVGLLSVPAISQAHKKTYATTITAAAQNKNQVQGNVASSNPKCLAQRGVRLYSSTGVLEATATTDAQGGFRIQNKNLAVGTHFVNVQKRVIKKSRRHRHACGPASTTFVVS